MFYFKYILYIWKVIITRFHHNYDEDEPDVTPLDTVLWYAHHILSTSLRFLESGEATKQIVRHADFQQMLLRNLVHIGQRLRQKLPAQFF